MHRPWTLGFISHVDEVKHVQQLTVEGEIPAWVSGLLLRNGPAIYHTDSQPLQHWYDGFAMLQRFALGDGAVTYQSRYLLSRAYASAQRRGKVRFSEFATDPTLGIVRRVINAFYPRITDNANVNIGRTDGQYVAMGHTPLRVVFDPITLKTVGIYQEEVPGGVDVTTAHPLYDLQSGETFNVGVKLRGERQYKVWKKRDGECAELLVRYPVEQPSYLQSFCLTKRYIILFESPYRLFPCRRFFGQKPYIENYRWQPEVPSRFLVFSRANGSLQGTFKVPPCFVLHHVRAYEDEKNIFVDLVGYDDAEILDELYLDHLLTEEHQGFSKGTLRRYTLSLDQQSASMKELSEGNVELPRLHDALDLSSPHRYIYCIHSPVPDAFPGGLVKVDTHSHQEKIWQQEGCFAGEPIFLPRPQGICEDDGVVLSVVLDTIHQRSFLLVLHARSFQELARAHGQGVIPLGLCGHFFEKEKPHSEVREEIFVEAFQNGPIRDDLPEPSPSRYGEVK